VQGSAAASPVVDSEVVYRRVHDVTDVHFMVVEEGIKGVIKRRPSSAVFKLSREEVGLSVYREVILARHGLDATALLKKPLSGVVALNVSDVRSEELDVVNDAWPAETDDPDHLRNAAHALITGLLDLSRSQRQKKADRLAKLADIVIDPT